MANVIRRYTTTEFVGSVLQKELAPGGFVGASSVCPTTVIDVTVDDSVENVREDCDATMLDLGFAFAAEDPSDTITKAAAILLKPVLDDVPV